MRKTLTLLLVCFAPTVSNGQGASVPRAIPLPDTLGTAFSLADSATRTGSPADFDFLVGVWEFRFQNRRPDGTFNPPFVGHWFVNKKQSPNPFIEDHFRGDNSSATYDVGTWTYRVFNPSRKLWEMQGVNSGQGAWAPGLCWSDANNRYLVQHYGPSVMRIRYLAITDTSFLWRADRSSDNGKTWINDWWTMSARRIAR